MNLTKGQIEFSIKD